MWEIPFISRRSHAETIAAKDETIAELRTVNQNLTDSLKAFDGLLESLKPKPRVPRLPGERSAPASPIDYGNLDPNDNRALARAALAEMGGGRHNIARVQQRAEHIRTQILEARSKPDSPTAFAATWPPPPSATVAAMIEEAIAAGEADAAARVN